MTRALRSIHVEGFRSLRNVTLEPGRVTVLIGPNGSGKSNLLSVLRMAPLIRTKSLRRFVGEQGGASALLHYGPATTREIVLRLEFEQENGGTNRYAARLGYTANDALAFQEEVVSYRAPETEEFGSAVFLGVGHAESHLEDEAKDPSHGIARAVRWWLLRMNFFHFHDTSATSPLRQNGRQEESDYLRSDGRNLAPYLYAMANSGHEADRAAWERINAIVRLVAPFVKELAPTLVAPAMQERSAVRLDWIDERDERFAAHHLSDGTLRAIALVTALGQPLSNLPAFITIDEPELGLHPAAIGILAGLVRSVSSRCQILLATQSPALLDQFEPENVVVAERLDGETRLERLKRSQLESWLEEYTLSEIWDKNIVGGRP